MSRSANKRQPTSIASSSSVVPDLPDDPRLMAAVQEYMTRLEAGERPLRQEFLNRFPDLADALAACLDGLEMIHVATGKEKPERPEPSDPFLQSPLGDFQIVREIGRGGMGIVYEAVQLSLARRVALKVLPFAAALDAKHLQRFRTEAQAAALLHHTNIVPVFAVGCERGVHFYAMQLIDGQSLAALIEEMREEKQENEPSSSPRLQGYVSRKTRGVPPPPSRGRVGVGGPSVEDQQVSHSAGKKAITTGLAPPPQPSPARGEGAKEEEKETLSAFALALTTQRSARPGDYFRPIARLIQQAAEALEHAHQFGIIHRDVKPANLLVNVHGQLWITDFGLAQMQTGTELTQTGDLLGTLRYMSPEQTSGERSLLDHRTDVYSLGATLYELTTLKPIFDGRNRQDLLYQILHEEPRTPRSIDKTIPVELETILLKAISKNATERYTTAREMAADLQRFLEDKPIHARRPTLVDRTRKWARRHPSLVGAALLFLFLCVVLLLVSNHMIATEQTKTQEALERERLRAEEAERLYLQARQAVDLLVQIGEEELSDKPNVSGAKRKLLETALVLYQDFLTQRHSADAQAELTAIQHRVQRLLDELATLQGTHQHMLIHMTQVQDDLGLEGEMRERIKALNRQWSEQRMADMKEYRQLSPATRRQRFLAIARRQEQQLAEVLTPSQRKRLGQIALQMQGPRVFFEPEVVAALKLTPDQRAKIRSMEDDWMVEFRVGPILRGPNGPGERGPGERGFGDRGPGERGFGDRRPRERGFGPRPPWERDMKADMEKVLGWLTPEQVQRWRELTGKPFVPADRIVPLPASPEP